MARASSPLRCLCLCALAAAQLARGEPDYGTTVVALDDEPEERAEERAGSEVRKKDLDRRLPRSAPDALRYEPGVFVQQSAHGQGSAFLRGMTGQQTLMLFDGIRLNNSTYRQGPNQYFFTLDSRTIRSIEVERGGASTRWGSDALGGVIVAHPLEPLRVKQGFAAEPRLFARGATADEELGGRVQVDLAGASASGMQVGLLAGFGARRVGLLHGPAVQNPNSSTDAGALPWVPRYQEYDSTLPFDQQRPLRTQLGTGFQERTADGRLAVRLSESQELTLAGYLYHQLDAPRTDQCPPPTAPYDQCLTYEQQYRHLAYAAWSGSFDGPLQRARVTLSWQEQHERRRLDLTAANLVGHGTDDVETFGLSAVAHGRRRGIGPGVTARLSAGADNYVDWLRSRAEHTYTDTLDTVVESRGQYLDGSTYVYGGAFGELAVELAELLWLRGGARLAWAAARADGDPASGTLPIDRAWVVPVGHVGLELAPASPLRVLVNYDHSFRAPNLDDLSSRQQTGPGFQFENAALRPERAHTFELGARLRTTWLVADAWVFETLLADAVLRVSKDVADCPANTPACQGSWSRFQLQNAPSRSELRGAEAAARLSLPYRVAARATVSYVWSEGPRVGSLSQGVYGVTVGERVPLSKTPPLNGSAELSWSHELGVGAGVALQWAAAQHRLALADYSDGRIPKYGTPGFAVVHLRASYRLGRKVSVAAVVENLFDTPYRFHGSSVNGAGRGVLLQLELGRLF